MSKKTLVDQAGTSPRRDGTELIDQLAWRMSEREARRRDRTGEAWSRWDGGKR